MSGDVKDIKGKRFFYKVYNTDGSFNTVWQKDVVNTPRFRWEINGGQNEMIIELARPSTDFGEADDVRINNEVKLFTHDEVNGTRQLYHGIIRGYEPFIEGSEQLIRVNLMPYFIRFGDELVKDSGDTTVVRNSSEPAQMMRDMVELLDAGFNGRPIENTGTTVSYTFSYVSYRESLDKIVQLAPLNWFYTVDGNDNVIFRESDLNTVDHELWVGKEIKSVGATKRVDNMVNAVYFLGGGDPPLYNLYEREASISEYGRREYKMKDTRVTIDATAQTMAERILDERDSPNNLMDITVVSNALDNSRGYDIDSIMPGDVIQVRHPDMELRESLWDAMIWDVDHWDYNILYSLGQPMQVERIDYFFDEVRLTLSTRIEDVTKRIEDISRNSDTTDSENIPTTPS